MIVPTIALERTDANGVTHVTVYNLATMVRYHEDEGGEVCLEYPNEIYSFYGEAAQRVRSAVATVNNMYQENANAYEKAKAQAASQIVTAQGMKIQ